MIGWSLQHRAAAERPRPIEHDTVWSGNRSALQARLGQRAAQLEVSGKCGGATATVETDRACLHLSRARCSFVCCWLLPALLAAEIPFWIVRGQACALRLCTWPSATRPPST